MDRWSQLSMSEKSDLMSLYIKNGISSLEEIKKHYNSFAAGGQMNTDDPDEPPQDQTITVSNPLFTTKGTLSQENADWDLGNQYTFKDTMRGIGLAGDYFSSEGFRNRANIANEKYGYLYNIEKPLRRTIPQQAAFIRDDNNANAAFKFGLNNSLNPIFVGAHETGHHNPVFNNYTFGMTTEEKAELSNPESTLYSPLYRNDYRNIPEDWRNILRNENPINDHDAELSEAYSDLVGLRALLKAYGIFDSTDPNAKFTQEMLDAFRKKLGNKGNRFLDYHSDENVIKAINEIAQNNTTEDTIHYAALGGHLYQDGGPDEPNFVGGATSVNPNYQVWEDLANRYTIEANKPSWQQGLTDDDWARARQYYNDADGNLTNQGIEFLKNISSKRTTGQSNFMRDVNKLSYIPNAAMLGAGALSGAAFNPYLWSAIGLASGAQNIEDKNYGEAALDIGLTLGAPVVKAVNTAIESTKLGKTLRVASEMNKAVRNTKFNKDINIPGQVGWAPKQMFRGYHASNEAIFKPDFWYENWARQTHQAPYGIYVAEGTTPTRGFLTKRPYIHNISADLDKPMIQIGELPSKSKNSARNQLERFAQSQGADAIIFQDIADNQMMHQNILKTLNPDTKLTINDKAQAVEELNLGQTYRETVNPTLADISYKATSFNNDPIMQMLYNDYISGKSTFGNMFPQKTVQTGLDDDAIQLLRNRTLNRDIQAIKEDPNLSSSFLGESRIKKLNEIFDKDLPSIKVGKYSGQDYKNAGHGDWGGFYNEQNRFISINRDSGLPMHKTQAHEGLHHIDSKHSLTAEQDAALSKAFDSDFNTLPETEYAPEHLKGYTHMRDERITTNRDARDELLGYEDMPLEKQNQIIDQATDDAIFNAIENANGYGRAYIKRLRAENKLTHEKANAFRESMKKVGVITGIIGTSAAATQK